MEVLKNSVIIRLSAWLKKHDFSQGNHFFELFSRECWIVTFFAPIIIIIPSLLIILAFGASSFFIGFLLAIIYFIVLLPWVFIPTWFLLYQTKQHTKQRKYAYGWIGVIFISIPGWLVVL